MDTVLGGVKTAWCTTHNTRRWIRLATLTSGSWLPLYFSIWLDSAPLTVGKDRRSHREVNPLVVLTSVLKTSSWFPVGPEIEWFHIWMSGRDWRWAMIGGSVSAAGPPMPAHQLVEWLHLATKLSRQTTFCPFSLKMKPNWTKLKIVKIWILAFLAQ